MLRHINKNNLIIPKLLVKEIKCNKELYKSFNFSHNRQKYILMDYVCAILKVINLGLSWRQSTEIKGINISWQSLHRVFLQLNKYDIFKNSYIQLLNKYLKRNKKTLKYINTDTTFIPNKKGIDCKGYNTYYNKKNGTKISVITNSEGVPLNIGCYKGNKHDSIIFMDQIKNIKLDKIKNSYFLADGAYDTKEIKNLLKNELHYKILIKENKRNNKNKKEKMTESEIEIYKNRLSIERTFNRIKNNKKIMYRYEKNIINFIGIIYYAYMDIIINIKKKES
jgi:ribosomal protein S16